MTSDFGPKHRRLRVTRDNSEIFEKQTLIIPLTLASTGKGLRQHPPPPKVFIIFFREYREHALADMAESLHSFASIFFTPTLEILASGHVRSHSYDAMFDRNQRILSSIVAE